MLNFWTYAARLQGDNYRTVIGMDDVLKALGIDPVPSLVGFIWREETEEAKSAEIAAFLTAVEQTNVVLATSDAAWDRIRHLVKPENDAEFAAIKAYYRAGIPAPVDGRRDEIGGEADAGTGRRRRCPAPGQRHAVRPQALPCGRQLTRRRAPRGSGA